MAFELLLNDRRISSQYRENKVWMTMEYTVK